MIGPVQPIWHVLAVRTAVALREANEKLGRPFPPNLSGACSVATMVLAEVLTVHGETPILVGGEFNGHAHVWLVVRRWVVDITASQFGYEGMARVEREGRKSASLPRGKFMERGRGQSQSYAARGKMDLPMTSACYRALRPHKCEHHSHPRRHHPLLIETLQRVLGLSEKQAAKRVRALVGRYVPHPYWWPKGPPSWARTHEPEANTLTVLRDFLEDEPPRFLEELPPIELSA